MRVSTNILMPAFLACLQNHRSSVGKCPRSGYSYLNQGQGNRSNTSRAMMQADVLSWSTSDPETSAFRLRRGWPPAPSYPVLGPDVVPPMYTDSGVLYDGRSYGYTVSGVNCAGAEGP